LDSLSAHIAAASGANTTVLYMSASDIEQWRALGGAVTYESFPA
jgi:hypothetical protein